MTELLPFARKLMRLTEKTVQSNTPTAIMGTIGNLPQSIAARAPYRIGLWPCVSKDKPELAMGLWVLLAHALERWRDVQVYRLFVKLEGDPEDFVWSIEQSQFDVDDWPVEPLDENIAIWGQLDKIEDKWQLTIFIENDMLTGEDNEPEEFVFTADSAVEFTGQIVTIAEKIAANIGAERRDDSDTQYDMDNIPDESVLLPLFTQLLEWDVHLLATLWGFDWDDDDIEDAFDDLLTTGKGIKQSVAAWAISKAVAHTLLPGYSVIGDLFVNRIEEITEALPESPYPAPQLAPPIFRLGYVQESYDLLERHVKQHPKRVDSWLKLAELYAVSGRITEAVDRFQSAIEEEAVNSHLYRAYGNVLLAADQYGEMVEEFVLIDLDDIDEDLIIWEAIEAYTEALELDPNDVSALYTQLLQLLYVDADEEEFWTGFRRLLKFEDAGELVRDVIDSMYEIEDISPGIEAIEQLIEEKGERLDLYINLASLHLANDDGDEAKPYLEKAKNVTESVSQLAEIERLLLAADNPDFEQQFGELSAIVAAGNKLSSDNVEFLEDVSENAPHVIDAHLLLARAYAAWDDSDAALEVLLDTQEKLPDNPYVLELLAEILWESDEQALAFEYLNRGLTIYPFHVPLLVRTGRYLFDNGQLAEARAYLSRAEEIAPGDPTLQGVRAYVARKMAENPEVYKEKNDE